MVEWRGCMRKLLFQLSHLARPFFPQWFVNYVYHLPLAALAAYVYGNPGKDLEIIGVTGTDGKTTTTTLIYHILKTARKKVAMISTVEARVGRKALKTGFHVTSPNPFALQALLRRMRSQKVRYVVLESTSHGLDQFRIFPLRPRVAVLTNITHEHLDYHKSFAAYRDAKLKLFKHAEHAVVNKDLPIFDDINTKLSKVLFSTYSIHSDSQLRPSSITYTESSSAFTLGRTTYTVPLSGEYNVYNSLAAVSTALILGIAPTDIKRALYTFPGVPGRLEPIENSRGLHAYVDFAHTPNALATVLSTLSSLKKSRERLIVVFGSAGLRDASKRPLMGEAAGKYADEIVVTTEDPRTERAEDIAQAIISGIPTSLKKHVHIELDRQKAIDYAVNTLAKRGDWVVACGKGHEESMNYDGYTEMPWSDRDAMQKSLAKNI